MLLPLALHFSLSSLCCVAAHFVQPWEIVVCFEATSKLPACCHVAVLLCCCWRAAFMPTWCFCEFWQREDEKIKTDGWREKIEDKHRLKSNRYDWFQINNHRTFPSMQCSHLNGQVKHADCLITTVGRENHIWINPCWIWVFSGKFKYLQICCVVDLFSGSQGSSLSSDSLL